ncbi:6-bladed beta-propeller [Algoriphagus lutimaris]|uniref:6-bladed beta-propeller n=1 Tax=Algoriphagus lutimaris TaxID=613197 RepID=UPI00196ABD6D|nr:6-bladed beta-propeller [Algoriphagus lutimaris]MBN3520398.1 6-bladed beta-propeller [Algoriphagus lutimaris]
MRFSYLSIFILLISCQESDNDSLERIQIEFGNEIENLSEIASTIEYIPLQDQPPHFLGNIDKMILTDNLIIAGDISTRPSINIYDTLGNFLSSIDYYGDGPGEYTHISDFGFDPIKKIISVSLVSKIIFYDLKGNFLGEHRTDVVYYKHIPLDDGKFLIYIPQVSAPELIGTGYKEGILFLEDPVQETSKQILKHTFPKGINTPYLFERNVFQIGKNEKLAFSHSFNDTVYVFDKNYNLEKKILIELGDFKLENKHFDKFDEAVEALNNVGEKAFNQNYLMFNGDYLSGKIRKDGYSYFFINNIRNKKTWLVGEYVNNIDGMLSYFQLRGMKNNTIFSIHRYEELDQEISKRIINPALKKKIEDNLFFIAKYKLKD